jgi:hypothetical protein
MIKHPNNWVLFYLLWSDENEKAEEKTKREIESSRTNRIDGRESTYIQEGAWGD